MDFYVGQALRVDLSAGTAVTEPLRMDWAERYMGGKGLLLRYMWEHVPPGVDAWAPENPVFLVTGPFAGTGVSTASRLVVGAKSPATGILDDSYVGGSFAPEMKFAGYDLIIITGKAAQPTVLWIKDGKVEFLPAEGKYWGLKTSAVEAALRADLDKDAKILSIGPAGENLVPWACLSTDRFHKAGRGGHGALFGSKNLKAVAIRGTGSVKVGDARAFLADMARIHKEHVLTDFNLWANEEGTPILVDPVNSAGALPTRNWSAGSFEGAAGINSEAFQKVKVANRACYQSAIGCRQVHEAGGIKGEGPKYETIALCGSNCGVGDLETLMRFNHECDEWGLDTISSGSVVALAMDMTERGVADFGLRFGEAAGYVAAPALIAQRGGSGAELALGARALAAKHGVPELAMEVKNLELPGYDPQGTFGMSLSYATSDRGGCHMRTYPIADEVLEGTRPADSMEGKARAGDQGQHRQRLHRAELQLHQVQRHLVRLLGGEPRPTVSDVQTRVEAGVHRRRDHAHRGADLEPRASAQPARRSGGRQPAPQALCHRGGLHGRPGGWEGHRRAGLAGVSGGVLPAARLGRDRHAHRGQVG